MSPTSITIRADAGHIKAFNFIGELAKRDPSMPLGAILVLLYLYEHRNRTQGVNLKDLRLDLGMNSTVASRSI